MQKKTLLVLVLLITLFEIGCKKKSDPPVYPIEGYWTGKSGLATATPNSDFVMVIEPGGKALYGNGTSLTNATIAKGDWTISGNTFKVTFVFNLPPTGNVPYTYQATFNTNGKLENGTIGPGSTVTGYGTWFAGRKN
jgi:hypothetical protein